LQAKLFQATVERAMRGPHRGDAFTLMQAFIEPDFWFFFFSLLLGSQ